MGRFSDEPKKPHLDWSVSGLDIEFLNVSQMTAQDDHNIWIQFAAAEIVWVPGLFDRTIRSIADETEANILFANPTRRTAYAPYDGGADLILPDSDSVDESRKRWASWLSPRPDGL